MPPTAARIGSAARRGVRRSPATNSRLSSSPTTKKKIASRPSAAHAPSDRSRCSAGRADSELAERVVRVGSRRVRPDERDQRRDEHERAADRLLAQDGGDAGGLGP